ncbi:signal peptidase II [Nisaea sediminum]|uniref:signal peptidase II n=1 Tax=Nisaea sediminum TaxID=2775867 RepID=UPI0029C04EE7|nr:signal peptidase II [Nisaea sediminum]
MTDAAKRSLKLGGLLALLVVLADQSTKQWALSTLFQDGRIVEVTPFFNLVAVWNRGVSFGLMASDDPMTPYYLSAFALAVVIGLGIWLSKATSPLLRISLGLIIGGAIGNVIDRIRFHAVVDFIDWHVAGYHWPAFNIADSAISIGVVFLLFDSFLGDSRRADAHISKGSGE